MVTQYRLDITAAISQVGQNGLAYGPPNRLTITDELSLELSGFGEVTAVLGAVNATIEKIREHNGMLAEIRRVTGVDPCNCRGDGWHAHVREDQAEHLPGGLAFSLIVQPGDTADGAGQGAEAGGSAGAADSAAGAGQAEPEAGS